MGTRGYNGINITTKRLIMFVANEAEQLMLPGVMRPEERYKETLVKVWEMVKNQVGYYGAKSYDLNTREVQVAYKNAEHYMNMLSMMYDKKEKDDAKD